MERWAKSIPEAQFLCICVESKQVAIAFHRMFQFENVVNGYIPSRGYMPVGYGQLGCSGFIVSDKDGYFVSRKTDAYLQYGDEAFKHVEALLADLIPTEENDSGATGMIVPTSESDQESSSHSASTRNKKIEAPASVGVDSMDDEHKECTDSFNKVIENPSSCNMQTLIDTLKSHFDHEEELMLRFSEESKTGTSSSFSSLESHKMDHQRIIRLGECELERVTGGETLKGK